MYETGLMDDIAVVLPHGAVGWSAVCDSGIFRSYSLAFFILIKRNQVINVTETT